MKKTYIVPVTKTYLVRINRNLLYSVSNATVGTTKGGWAKEENAWDDEDF